MQTQAVVLACGFSLHFPRSCTRAGNKGITSLCVWSIEQSDQWLLGTTITIHGHLVHTRKFSQNFRRFGDYTATSIPFRPVQIYSNYLPVSPNKSRRPETALLLALVGASQCGALVDVQLGRAWASPTLTGCLVLVAMVYRTSIGRTSNLFAPVTSRAPCGWGENGCLSRTFRIFPAERFKWSLYRTIRQ